MIKAFIFLLVFLLVLSLFFFSWKFRKKMQVISISLLFIIITIFSAALILLKNDHSEKVYNPPRFDGEKIIPGYFNEKN